MISQEMKAVNEMQQDINSLKKELSEVKNRVKWLEERDPAYGKTWGGFPPDSIPKMPDSFPWPYPYSQVQNPEFPKFYMQSGENV